MQDGALTPECLPAVRCDQPRNRLRLHPPDPPAGGGASSTRCRPARSLRNVFQPYAATSREIGSRFSHATQKLRVILQAIREPIVFRLEADQDAGRAPVTRDDNLFGRGQAQISRQVILHLRERDFTAPPRRTARATPRLALSRRWRGPGLPG